MRKGFSGLRGFVNGVLRTVAREKENIRWPDRQQEPLRALSVQYSVSAEILSAWLPRYGEEKTEAICRAFLEDRPLTVHRFAAAADSADKYSQEVRGRDTEILRDTGILGNSYFLKKGIDPAEVPEFHEGKLYVQDLSSQIAIAAAAIRPGERVLDLCAAPGGKSLLAAERGAQVLARDLTEEKVSLIRENAVRMQFAEEKETHGTAPASAIRAQAADAASTIRAQAADAAVYDPDLKEAFDLVIADLPCSGFGVAGKKPEIKYKAYEETVTALAELQRTILANAVRYVRPGGRLLFSTCTIAEEENEDNARWLLENYGLQPATRSDAPQRTNYARQTAERMDASQKSNFFLQPAEVSEEVQEVLRSRSIPFGKYGVQLLPSDGPWDGFYFALFRKQDK